MDIEIKRLKEDTDTLKQLIRLYAEVFETPVFTMPDDTYLNGLLHNPMQLFIIALKDKTLAGGLTAYVLPSVYRPSPDIYLYDIAVKKNLQRSGIGTLLMHRLFEEGKRMGASEVFVQADSADRHALNFYKQSGGHAETDVMHFSYIIK
ncbi:hypothetical protein A8C56_20380 [Niabella ginsenosidivorans]|uniref:N-acetyltransferase domain-containing protein n=1 Tax=Niabella ginsenosidivorans TaxID=1176587 RepID=A0A1A9I5Q9_9BACT|nr:GNAT family N-acetyltransferase [Niabella ginsenosidivorans]ANH83027.1 hypothetical protein A8C56_20380 [Niabella ginsenosidivorans]